jgi:transcriptional regulator with XRE-family HTH domain
MPFLESRHLCNASIRECSTPSVKCFAVPMEQPETLADYVRRIRLEKHLSLNDVVRQSDNQIANSHVSRIENGLTTNITTEKLRSLAKGLGVPEDEIFSVARGKQSEPMTRERFFAELMAMGVEDFHAAKGTTALTPADMEEILAVVRSTAKTMVEQKIKAKKR